MAELAEIWRWNAERHAPAHADRYLDALKQIVFGLAHSYARGKSIAVRPDLRYVLVRRKPIAYCTVNEPGEHREAGNTGLPLVALAHELRTLQ